MGIKPCIPVLKKYDDQSAKFKAAKKILSNEIFGKESKISSSKAKQTVLDVPSPTKRTLRSLPREPKIVESNMLATAIVGFFYENELSLNVVDSESFLLLWFISAFHSDTSIADTNIITNHPIDTKSVAPSSGCSIRRNCC